MVDFLSLAEARLQPDVDLAVLLAAAKRRPDRLPLYLLPPRDGWPARFVTRVRTSAPDEPERGSYSTVEVLLREPFRLDPGLVRAGGDLLLHRFRLDGRRADVGGDAQEYYEFFSPRPFDVSEVTVRRGDLERWRAVTTALDSASEEVERRTTLVRIAAEMSQFTLSTREAQELLGVSGNTLYKRRNQSERLDMPQVWRVLNPEAKTRKTYRWLADEEALRNWSSLLDLLNPGGAGETVVKPRVRRARARRSQHRKGRVAKELDELLG